MWYTKEVKCRKSRGDRFNLFRMKGVNGIMGQMIIELVRLWIVFFLIGAGSAGVVMMRFQQAAKGRWTPIQECQLFFYFVTRAIIPGVNLYYCFRWWVDLIFELNQERFFHSISSLKK